MTPIIISSSEGILLFHPYEASGVLCSGVSSEFRHFRIEDRPIRSSGTSPVGCTGQMNAMRYSH